MNFIKRLSPIWFILPALLILLSACQAPSAASAPAATDVPHTEAPEPTATAVPPTDVPEPTVTPISPTATPAPLQESDPMVGTWILRSQHDDVYMQLNADGSFAIAILYNDLEKFPQMKGSYEIDGDMLNITVDAGRTLYCEEETGQYTIIPVDSDQFHLDKLAWDCKNFRLYVATERLIWERYAGE